MSKIGDGLLMFATASVLIRGSIARGNSGESSTTIELFKVCTTPQIIKVKACFSSTESEFGVVDGYKVDTISPKDFYRLVDGWQDGWIMNERIIIIEAASANSGDSRFIAQEHLSFFVPLLVLQQLLAHGGQREGFSLSAQIRIAGELGKVLLRGRDKIRRVINIP